MYPQRSVMTCGLATALEPPHFNHAPVRGATSRTWSTCHSQPSFQSTHPRGVRPCASCTSAKPVICFNPRTRVGCDGSSLLVSSGTSGFQSTHPRGVRHSTATGGNVQASFNPRTRVGCDSDWREAMALQRFVSIHAPAWGATDLCGKGDTGRTGFNPRTRVGCDIS